ncbi:hypothetical protein DJ69_00695 [Halorubrum persicum]|uniref:Big-1 domain-containing protein n=1 Tax=Halorubrum persicum TaxID=1383844 RepID=A0A2G1WNG0_9EURY|nr:carboxypeptidase regulatory-like domain-containing protein [Halorubrum persicum]PHQ40522.1 hypothetical protein DJ69_00695 [Halorubrum persicum]
MEIKLTQSQLLQILVVFTVVVAGCTGVAAATTDGDTPTTQKPAEAIDQEPGQSEISFSDTPLTSGSVVPMDAVSDETFGEETRLSITVVPVGESFGSNETMTIFVGAFDGNNMPTPVANEQVTISIERPDGTSETFEVVTGSDGTVEKSYDLSEGNRGDGTYAISATSASVSDEATVEAKVGTAISAAERREDVLIGEETTSKFLVRDGTASVPQKTVNFRIVGPSGSVINEQQKTTDADGFVETQFTPQTIGRYEITAEVAETGATVRHSLTAKEVAFRTGLFAVDEAITGEQASYGGYLFDTSGLLSGETISVEIVNPATGESVVDTTVTTDSSGFFTVDYNPGTASNLRATVTTADGRVAVDEDFINVNEPGPAGVDIAAEFTESSHIPGDEATLTIEATENGTPIANKQVTVFPRLGFNGPPIDSQTVTTNATGEASVQVSIPDAAESARIGGQAYIQYNGEVVSDTLSTDIEQYDINFDIEDVAPGEETTFSVEATNRITDSPASNVPVQFNALYSGSGIDSYATGELETDQSGTDSTTVAVPEDLEPDRAVNYMSRYASPTLYRINMYDFPGSVELTSGSETDDGRPAATPGEELDVAFTTPDGADATGIVFARFGHSADSSVEGSVMEPISASQDGTLTVPEYAAADDYVRVSVWAATSSDKFYVANQFIEVRSTGDSVPNALSVSLSSSSISANQESFNVTVTDEAGDPVEGATVEVSELGLSETTDATGEATLQFSEPDPGEYTITVTADEFSDATETLTVEEQNNDEGGGSDDGNQTQAGNLTLQAVDVPKTVQPNSTFSATYEVENRGEAVNAYTIEMAVDRDNVTVTGFSGDIQASDVNNQPPSASTDAIAAGERATVTISYQVAANTTGNTSLTATARNPLTGANATLSQDVSIETATAAPTDPTQRALQITGKNDPSELTQSDVTAVITRFSRDQSVNNVTVTQNDVTATITLFERN